MGEKRNFTGEAIGAIENSLETEYADLANEFSKLEREAATVFSGDVADGINQATNYYMEVEETKDHTAEQFNKALSDVGQLESSTQTKFRQTTNELNTLARQLKTAQGKIGTIKPVEKPAQGSGGTGSTVAPGKNTGGTGSGRDNGLGYSGDSGGGYGGGYGYGGASDIYPKIGTPGTPGYGREVAMAAAAAAAAGAPLLLSSSQEEARVAYNKTNKNLLMGQQKRVRKTYAAQGGKRQVPTGMQVSAKRGSALVCVWENAEVVDYRNDYPGSGKHGGYKTGEEDWSYGNYVKLKVTNPDGSVVYVMLSHLDEVPPDIQKGMVLGQGDALGTVGSTGNVLPYNPATQGAYLGLQVQDEQGRTIPPDPYFDFETGEDAEN